jgi:hypothetical protein
LTGRQIVKMRHAPRRTAAAPGSSAISLMATGMASPPRLDSRRATKDGYLSADGERHQQQTTTTSFTPVVRKDDVLRGHSRAVASGPTNVPRWSSGSAMTTSGSTTVRRPAAVLVGPASLPPSRSSATRRDTRSVEDARSRSPRRSPTSSAHRRPGTAESRMSGTAHRPRRQVQTIIDPAHLRAERHHDVRTRLPAGCPSSFQNRLSCAGDVSCHGAARRESRPRLRSRCCLRQKASLSSFR